jgi:hypothetical protein
MENKSGDARDDAKIKFNSLMEATVWTLERLAKVSDVSSGLRGQINKYQDALSALNMSNWGPAQKVLKEQFAISQRSLATDKTHSLDKPITCAAVFYGILSTLVDQRLELVKQVIGSEVAKFHYQQVVMKLKNLPAIREYRHEWDDFSVPMMLNELSGLAPNLFSHKR